MWAVGWFAFLSPVLCPFPCLIISRLCLQAFLSLFFLTSGASSPEWVKPTAEGGGLLVIYFLSYLRCACDFTVLLYVRFLFFVNIGIMADGR
jgi:hypothetical protein